MKCAIYIFVYEEIMGFYFPQKLFLIKFSAISTAFKAAPLKRLSETIHIFNPLFKVLSSLILEMNSQKAVYDDQTNIIELFSKVKIVKGQEIITGDYGYFDTIKNSYKVKSDNTSKVKVTIKSSNE